MKCNNDHDCYCGTGKGTPHKTGEDGCVRFMVEDPINYHGKWIVNGIEITDFTLREQRGYCEHVCGCWSRWPGSKNSIDV